MKKIKLLFAILCLSVFIIIMHYFLLSYNWHLMPHSNTNKLGEWTVYYHLLSPGALLISILMLIIGLFEIIRNHYFSKKSIKFIRLGGVILLCLGVISLSIDITSLIANAPFDTDPYVAVIFLSFFMTVFGLTILTITDIQKNGLQIKQENDLTI